jgi:hypothetical protein
VPVASDLQLVVAAGLFSLGGVALGALATTGTQLFLDKKRERRTADRAKRLVAGELLQAQLILRAASKGTTWPAIEDVNAYLPTSAWQENKSILVGEVDEGLYDQLVLDYALLESDKQRIIVANKITPLPPLQAQQADEFREAVKKLGLRRKQLGAGGRWLDEIKDELRTSGSAAASP